MTNRFTPKTVGYVLIGFLLIIGLSRSVAKAELPEDPHLIAANANGPSFSITYTPAETQLGQSVQNFLQQAQIYEQMYLGFNNIFALQEPLTLNQRECGTVNAFYSPSDRQIIMCYELADYLFNLFADHRQPGDAPIELPTISTLAFVMLHELGHAFVDILDVPVLGREEDAVDQFSTVLLAQTGGGRETAEGAATWFYLESQKDNMVQIPYWGEHSLNIQRFHSIICLLYGSSPDNYRDLMLSLNIPERRQAMCQQEFVEALENWGDILAPIRVGA